MAPSAVSPPSTATLHAPSKSLPISTSSPNNDDDVESKSALQAISCGATLPGIPTYPSFSAARKDMLAHMAGAFRVFARKDYTEGMSGHISLRDPQYPSCFWTNPLGRHFGLLRASDMILVDPLGRPIGGNMSRPANAAGFLIHAAVHEARPDVNAACHTHSPYGKAWSAFGRRLEMINQDVCYFYGAAQAVYEEFGGVVLKPEEGRRLAAALGAEGKGMVLRNHGLLTVGGTVDEAAYLFTLMERSAQCQLLVEAAAANGVEKVLVPEEAARFTFKMASDAEALYAEFQPDLEFEVELAGGRKEKLSKLVDMMMFVHRQFTS
ncbi:arad-like aldolase/epimerase [Myriangium duriaei CBS 260.36]|uniref:Arad-like aldolase/epimerase n=1 Tax=Myriangium duriaei CBS 260.36 TaxID=1168546 RepID=A0A9P4MF22_9PEZI|nr:arad-like aldolase/epimerase [Myriangium duriaei CBS 260.36]